MIDGYLTSVNKYYILLPTISDDLRGERAWGNAIPLLFLLRKRRSP